MKVGDRIRVIVEPERCREYQRSMTDSTMIVIPLHEVLTITSINFHGDIYGFEWEGMERFLYSWDVERVCECSPSSLLLFGCTCGG
jgi:hypothetical protein